MRRRSLLALGLGGAAVLALVGGGLAWWTPGLQGARLGDRGRIVFRAVGRAVLDGLLPAEPAAREAALDRLVDRLDATIAGLPPATRAELSQLLALLAHPAGRRAFAGLPADWPDATLPELQSALQSMRGSSIALREQAYHALRTLTNAAWFADPESWPAIGYPGPRAL